MSSTEEKKTAKPTIATNRRLHSADISHDADVPDIAFQERKNTGDYSKPVVTKNITIYSNQVQRLFEHLYVRTDYSLYAATKVLRSIGRTDDARLAEKTLYDLFTLFAKDISVAIDEQEALLKANVEAGEGGYITYDFKRDFAVPVRTGYSLRLVNLTQQLDYLVSIFEALEINNLLTPDDSDRSIKAWLLRFRVLCKSINQLRVKYLAGGGNLPPPKPPESSAPSS